MLKIYINFHEKPLIHFFPPSLFSVVLLAKLFPFLEQNKVIKLKENAFGKAEWASGWLEAREVQNLLYRSNIIIGFHSIKVSAVNVTQIPILNVFIAVFMKKKVLWRRTTDFSLINISSLRPLVLIVDCLFREEVTSNPQDVMEKLRW